MSTLTDEAKRVKKLHKSYNDARKQIKAAMEQCSPGTNTHLAHIKALSELDSRERAEEIALGLTPANLGAMVTTEFIYVAHVQAMPANRAELEKLLGRQMVKASDGLHYDDADEAIREQLQSEFK
jgi:hypothetical protein